MESRMNCGRILSFWRGFEALTPQNASKHRPHDKVAPVYKLNGADALMPWLDPKHRTKKAKKGRKWMYRLECGLYNKDALADMVVAKAGGGKPGYAERSDGGTSRVFDLSFDDSGRPLPETFVLSMNCWASGLVLKFGFDALKDGSKCNISGIREPDDETPEPRSGYAGFDTLYMHLIENIRERAADLHAPADKRWVDDLLDFVLEKCWLPPSIVENPVAHMVVCRQVKDVKGKGDEASRDDGLLNSFFIDDLGMLASMSDDELGKNLTQYIRSVATESHGRIDLRTSDGEREIERLLAPEAFPHGCWPSAYPLVLSQQYAVNKIMSVLKRSGGIHAVNGPPGTGKTTLLRDIVASVIVERAKIIVDVEREGGAFGTKNRVSVGGKECWLYNIDDRLRGHAIVVASSNNGAVENVTLELPGIRAVPEKVHDRLDYFRRLASNLVGGEAWALISARLGNKANRSEFVDKFWWQTPPRNEDDEIPVAESMTNKEGLRFHLKAVLDGKRTPGVAWKDAVKRFKDALAREEKIRRKLAKARRVPSEIIAKERALREPELHLRRLRGSIADAEKEKGKIEAKLLSSRKDIELAQREIEEYQKTKPGILAIIVTLGRAYRNWWEKMNDLESRMGDLRKRECCLSNQLQDAEKLVRELRASVKSVRDEMQKVESQLETLRNELSRARKWIGGHWYEVEKERDAREQSSPWAVDEWREARSEVFLAALDVHRAFIEKHPKEMLANLGVAVDWLSGKNVDQPSACTAMDCLALAVPVVSTTFASMSRMYKNAGRNGIGWLLIDEAGQAPPQVAAGAIWRSKRIVVVGDPMQLEPVVTVPEAIENALAKASGLSHFWNPSSASVQTLADQTMAVGTFIENAAGDKTWVGSPLCVHRRCDEPMFSISNAIAYGGMMVNGKVKGGKCLLPPSAWFDVCSAGANGHWIDAEGEMATNVIARLFREYDIKADQVFVISPFRDVVWQLRRMSNELKIERNQIGTVHTVQGKEADIVILVLGGDPSKPGAKDWAASKPNLLNVAVTRAKKRLYVIGDHKEWSKRRFFLDMAQKIEKKTEA